MEQPLERLQSDLVSGHTLEPSKKSLVKSWKFWLILISVFLIVGVASLIRLTKKMPSGNYAVLAANLKRPVIDTFRDYANASSTDLTGISFTAPSDVFVLDKNYLGNLTLPAIFFEKYEPKDWHRRKEFDDQPEVDSITFDAFLRFEDATSSQDLPVKDHSGGAYIQLPSAETGLSSYYRDSSDSQPFDLNGYRAVRYYLALYANSNIRKIQQRTKGQKVDLDYLLQERVYMTDPYFADRIVFVTYQQVVKKSEIGELSELSAEKIQKKFDPKKYGVFQEVLRSLKLVPIDRTSSAHFYSTELGIKFDYPWHWGIPNVQLDGDPSYIGFTNAALSYETDIVPPIMWMSLDLHDQNNSGDWYYPSAPRIFDVAKPSLDSACQKKEWEELDGDRVWGISKLRECGFYISPEGFRVLYYNGDHFEARYSHGEEPDVSDKPEPYEGILFTTKSPRLPIFSIYTPFIDEETESALRQIINSLGYISQN